MVRHTFKHLFTPHKHNNHRPTILHVEGLAVLAGIFVLFEVVLGIYSRFSHHYPTILGFASSITASQVVDQTNDQRAALGLSKLTVNSQLVSAALSKGSNMCEEQYWAHISPKGTTPWFFMRQAGYVYSVAGENLARDFADTGSMVTAWMASPTHRANIVNDKYAEIGVAVLDCKLLGTDTALVVQMFGSQKTATATQPQTTTVAAATATSAPVRLATPTPTPADEELTQAPATLSAQQTEEIAGKESIPVLIANANPSLQLEDTNLSTNVRVFSTLQITKAVIIAILCVLMVVLYTDMWVAHKRRTVRVVGKNLAHLLFLAGIFIAVLIIKAGVISSYGL